MDVNELKAWPREKLQAKAIERGVRGAEFLTRTELVTLLSGRDESARSPLTLARNLLRSLLEKTFPTDDVPPSVQTGAPRSETRPQEPVDTEAGPPMSMSIVPTTEDEPIQTRTMARLLANQGHSERALAIYDLLVSESPEDADLKAERDELALTGNLSSGAEYASDHLEITRTHATSIFVRWELTQSGVKRASALCSSDPALTLRLVCLDADENAVVTSVVRDFAAEGRVGEKLIADLSPTSACVAAVGVGTGAAFVSIAHADAPAAALIDSN